MPKCSYKLIIYILKFTARPLLMYGCFRSRPLRCHTSFITKHKVPMKIRIFLTLIGVAVALNLPSEANPHTPITSGTLNVKTGSTSISLDPQFASALTTSEFSFEKVIPGRIKHGKGELNFPIVGGAFDLADLHSEIMSTGGFSLTQGTATVAISDLVVTTPAATDTSTIPTLSALITVNGVFQGRVDLFSIDLTGITAPYTLPPNKKVVLRDLPLKLTADGATALNTAFATTSFTADTTAGTVTVNAITSHGHGSL